MSLRVNNFGNSEAMGLIFFTKFLKCYVSTKTTMEILKKVFGLLDNCIRIDWAIFFLLWQGYLSSGVTVLENSPKISDLTMWDVFELNLSLNNETIAQTFSGADFCSIPVYTLTAEGCSYTFKKLRLS